MNLNRLNKSQIVWLNNHRCNKHGHTYLEHYPCLEVDERVDSPVTEKIGFLDIEASNLKGDFMIVLTVCIKELGGKVWSRSITADELKSNALDKNLMVDVINKMREYDKLVGYYSTKYDMPSLRTRALLYNLKFPTYKEIKHTDVYYMVKSKMNLSRNRLETVCDFLGIPAKIHKINPVIWTKALTGNLKCLRWIETHCKEDVISLETLYKRLIDFSAPNDKSL